MPNNPFSFGASAAPVVPNSQPQPGAQPLDPMALLAQLISGSQQPQQQTTPDLGGMLAGIRQAKDPQGAADKGYIPGQNNAFSPFSNGFFKTAEQRQQVEQNHLGGPGFSSIPQAQQGQLLQQHMAPNPAENAALASPAPFQLDPSTLAQIHGQQNPQTLQGMVGQPTPNPFVGFGQPTRPPRFSGPTATPSAKGSPAKSPFSFGF